MNLLGYLMEPDADPPNLEEFKRNGGYSYKGSPNHLLKALLSK